MELWNEWTDMLGQTVIPGDIIAYGTGNNYIDLGRIEKINKFNSKGEPIIKPSYQDNGDPSLHAEIMAADFADRMNHPRYQEWRRTCNWDRDEPGATFTVQPVERVAQSFILNPRRTKVNVKYPHLTIRVDLP